MPKNYAYYPIDIHILPHHIQKRITLKYLQDLRDRCSKKVNISRGQECQQLCYYYWKKFLATRRHPFGESANTKERYCALCGLITLNKVCFCCQLRIPYILTFEERQKIEKEKRY